MTRIRRTLPLVARERRRAQETRGDLRSMASILARLTRRKSLADLQAAHEGSDLKRVLGPINLIFFGIGTIIGTGIFVLTGQAAAQYAGPGIMISFVITGVLCALVALCYAELASAIPISGSAYSY